MPSWQAWWPRAQARYDFLDPLGRGEAKDQGDEFADVGHGELLLEGLGHAGYRAAPL